MCPTAIDRSPAPSVTSLDNDLLSTYHTSTVNSCLGSHRSSRSICPRCNSSSFWRQTWYESQVFAMETELFVQIWFLFFLVFLLILSLPLLPAMSSLCPTLDTWVPLLLQQECMHRSAWTGVAVALFCVGIALAIKLQYAWLFRRGDISSNKNKAVYSTDICSSK